MLCPNCNHELKEVATNSHYGAVIKLNQCSCCGGIWFNNWELFSLEEAEAKKLDSVDAEKLKTACGVSMKKKMCPECGAQLEKFHDANIPEEIDIESCRTCGGFWLNRGETAEYKEYQQNKIQQSRLRQEKMASSVENEDEFTKRMHSLLESERSGTYSAIGRLGNFLSTPVMRPNERMGENNNGLAAGNTAYVAIQILNIILRLLIGR